SEAKEERSTPNIQIRTPRLSGNELRGRHRRSVRVSSRERANQSNRHVKQKPVVHKIRARFEAGAGIEPANSGFADRSLTTWLPRRLRDCNYRRRSASVNRTQANGAGIEWWSNGVLD